MTRRRTALLLISVAWVCHGVTILHQPGWRDPGEAILFEMWPLWLRIGIWLVCGLAGIVLAASANHRAEALGFALAVIPPTLRVVSYGWSVLMWVIPGAPGGEWASAAYATYWVAVLLLAYWVARWPEPGAAPKGAA